METMFSVIQAAVRKYVERVFSVLFKRFGILQRPSRFHHIGTMRSDLLTCVTLHNMLVEAQCSEYVGLEEDGRFGLQIPSVARSIPKTQSIEKV